jgi:Secretion system C-terminal sorting domain
MKTKLIRYFTVAAVSLSVSRGFSQTITSVTRITSPTLPNAGLIVNGGFETGAPPLNTWYQWAKTGCVPVPANRNPGSWTVTAAASNSSGGNPIRYATWGRLVTGTGGSGTYPFIPTNQSGLYEVYSTTSTACTNTNTTAGSSDPGTFPLGVASADGINYLYFGNGTGTVTGFPTPLAAWVSSSGSPNNLRVYADNSSLGALTGPAPVTLAQTVTTTSGSAYILEFWVSGEEINVGTQKDGFFQLQIGTQNLYLAIPGSGNNHGLGNQFYYQIKFNAAAISTTIKFINYCHPVGGNWAGYLAGSPGSELILDDVRMNLASILPVQLISFNGIKTGTKNNLSWKVASQISFSHYEIERTFNLNEQFVNIGSVASDSNPAGSYRYTDDINTNQLAENVYYRLKMIDVDGRFSYSNVIRIQIKGISALKIITNPVPDDLNISGLKSRGQISIFDLSGKVLLEKNVLSQAMSMNISSIKPGLYVLKYADGENIETQKFIKQ